MPVANLGDVSAADWPAALQPIIQRFEQAIINREKAKTYSGMDASLVDVIDDEYTMSKAVLTAMLTNIASSIMTDEICMQTLDALTTLRKEFELKRKSWWRR